MLRGGSSGARERTGGAAAAARALRLDIEHVSTSSEDGPGRRLGRSFRVKLWPNLVFLKNGMVVRELARPSDRELKEAFEALAKAE